MLGRFGLIIRRKILIIIFIVLVIFAGSIIYWYILEIRERNNIASEDISIITSRKLIKEGDILKNDMIEIQKIPKKIFNSSYITDFNQIEGKIVTQDIQTGIIITNEMIEGMNNLKKKHLKFSASIPKDLRAIAIPVNFYGEKSLPDIGDYIDILTIYFDRGTDKVICETLLQKKEIILIEGRENYVTGDLESNYRNLIGGKTVKTSSINGILSLNDQLINGYEPLIITLFLNPIEVEKTFLALQSGILNVSICPVTD